MGMHTNHGWEVSMIGLGLPEYLVIFLVVLLFFGARRLPDLAGGLSKGIRLFKKGLKEDQQEAMKGIRPPPPDGLPKKGETAPIS